MTRNDRKAIEKLLTAVRLLVYTTNEPYYKDEVLRLVTQAEDLFWAGVAED